MTEHHARLQRALEVVLYAPVGLGLFLKDAAPNFVAMFVSRGRAEVDRRHGEIQQRVHAARGVGRVAVTFGPPIVRQRVERVVGDARRRAESTFGTPADTPESPGGPTTDTAGAAGANGAASAPPSRSVTEPAEDHPAPAVPAAQPTTWIPAGPTAAPPAAPAVGSPHREAPDPAGATLPIPGYDALSASQVVERLIGLAPEELRAVHKYESTHRQRRTILGKIEQLTG